MTLERGFRTTIILSGILMVLVVLIVVFEIEVGNAEIESIEENLPKGYIEKTFGEFAFIILTSLMILLNIVSLLLLYIFYKFGKLLFVLYVILVLITIIFDGPVLATPTIELLAVIGSMLDGAILVFLFFTPIKERFSAST